jgi:hypothetical protein
MYSLHDSINKGESEINQAFQKIELFIAICRLPMSFSTSFQEAGGGGRRNLLSLVMASALTRIMTLWGWGGVKEPQQMLV